MKKCLESHSNWLSRKIPFGQSAGNFICFQNSSSPHDAKRFRSILARTCHRKGCSNRFLPRRPYQKFCLDPTCVVQLRRWQATKRQRRHRVSPENRQKHAERERLRRLEKAARIVPVVDSKSQTEPKKLDSAWSRPTAIPKDFCDRPGCYEPKVNSDRNQAKYCGITCRNAVHRVRERDRQYRTSRYRWPKSPMQSPVNYSGSFDSLIPLLHSKRSNHHDSKASSLSAARSPPTQM